MKMKAKPPVKVTTLVVRFDRTEVVDQCADLVSCLNGLPAAVSLPLYVSGSRAGSALALQTSG